ncbi:MAG TPA: SGNH/GDSL hydrolase family protein, partial [Stellaceae bacterium]
VLVMGDSFTFGDGVNEGEAFPQVADRASGTGNGAPWEVLDLGVSAWGPQNALAYLETEGAPIQASCLIYTFFLGNDVMDNAASHLYSLRDGRLEKNPVVSAPPSSADRVKGLMHALPFYDLLLDHSQIFNLIRAVFIGKTTDYRALADTYAEVPREAYVRALDLNDATLARMARIAQDRFGAFALILLPELAQLDGAPDLHPSLELVPVDLAEEGRVRVKQWAQANSVPVLDLVELLPHDPAAARHLYFQRDFHMNAAGHKRLGELLAQQLPRLCDARHPPRQSAQG